MGPQAGHDIGPSGDDPGLRPPKQLVARKHDQIDPGAQDVPDHRFVGQTPGRQVDQHAAAQILHQDHVLRPGKLRKLRPIGCRGETDDPEVAGVAFQQHGGVFVDRLGVVGQASLVGGAHFPQLGAALGDHVRQPEGAADLDQFAARGDDLAPLGCRHEAQKHGGRAIVDDDRRLRPGQLADQPFRVAVPGSALAGVDVVFKVHGLCRDSLHRGHGFGRQAGAAQIGMDQDARRVDERAQRRGPACLDCLGHLPREGNGCEIGKGVRLARPQGVAQPVEDPAKGVDGLVMAGGACKIAQRRLAQQRLDLRQVPELCGHLSPLSDRTARRTAPPFRIRPVSGLRSLSDRRARPLPAARAR